MRRKITAYLLVLFTIGYATAQELTISGKVKNEEGEPVVGAQVKVVRKLSYNLYRC